MAETRVPTASGIQGWSYQVIRNILTNEKYMGDALLGKTYVTDCISKKVRKNCGERTQCYVEDNHPAIIPREMFYRVREEMARRSSKRKVMQRHGKTERGKYSAKYALSERLVCGECGSPYSAAPGPEMERSGSCGGVSPGWSSGRSTAAILPPWTRTGFTGPSWRPSTSSPRSKGP